MKYATTGVEVTHIVMSAPTVQDLVVFRRLLNRKDELAEYGLFGLFETLLEKAINTGESILVEKDKATEYHDVFGNCIVDFVSDDYDTNPKKIARNLANRLLTAASFECFLNDLQKALKVKARDL